MSNETKGPQPPAEAHPDWEVAPPGATHYQPHQGAYYKRVSASEWYVWSRDDDREVMRWLPSLGTRDNAEWVVRPVEAPPSAPVGVEGLPPDVQEIVRKDDAAWALAERAEAAGAERDSDDDGTWWTLRIEHFKALAQPFAPDSDKAMKWHAWRLTRLRDQLRNGLRPDELKAFEAALAALTDLAQQPAAREAEPKLDAHDPASGELVAQWLFRNDLRELAAVVRAQLDMRAQQPAAVDGADAKDAEIKALRAEVEALNRHGTLLSNIAYNLAQDDRLSDSVRWSLDDSRKKWDAAIHPAAAQEGK